MSEQRFPGFSAEGARFFRTLAKKQDRAWFKAHQADFEALWKGPMEALMDELARALDPVYPTLDLAPPKVFRIHRDVRFSADKSPYKTNIAGILSVAGGGSGPGAVTEGAAAIYAHFGLENLGAAGQFNLSTEGLARYRAAVLAEPTGKEVAGLVKRLEKAGFRPIAMSSLKKTPRGVDPDHPRAALLRLKGLAVSFPPIPAELLYDRKLLGWLVKQAKAAAPLVEWMAYTTR